MGLFHKLFGKRGHPPDPMKPTEVKPGLYLPKALADFWPQILATERTAIQITATPVDTPANRPNSFGCYPTVPRGFVYPRDDQGNFLYPLAQIHCADLPRLPDFPESGYLQFYISVDDGYLYGIDFDEPTLQEGFRVLYFEESEVADPETEFGFLDEILQSDYSPVARPHTLAFSVQQDYIGLNEAGWEKRLPFFEALQKENPALAADLEDELFEVFHDNGHKIGGYLYTTQFDPRDADTRDWQLLFQMDSDRKIMWGDVGVANFFIHPDRLKAKDFSTVLYNWDCS